MGIYKSEEGKEKTLKLYDEQLTKLGADYSDIFVKTTFGRTHLIQTGNKSGIPLQIGRASCRERV